jgi:hypothetical protein
VELVYVLLEHVLGGRCRDIGVRHHRSIDCYKVGTMVRKYQHIHKLRVISSILVTWSSTTTAESERHSLVRVSDSESNNLSILSRTKKHV